MKPDWDKLADELTGGERFKIALVADVDCTADNAKKLCTDHGVAGYPTIMHGEASKLEKYEGGRRYSDLMAFALPFLGPECGPGVHIELCNDEKKKHILDWQALTPKELEAQIAAQEAKIAAANNEFGAGVTKLNAKFEELRKNKTSNVAAIKDEEYGFYNSIFAAVKDKDSVWASIEKKKKEAQEATKVEFAVTDE